MDPFLTWLMLSTLRFSYWTSLRVECYQLNLFANERLFYLRIMCFIVHLMSSARPRPRRTSVFYSMAECPSSVLPLSYRFYEV